MKIDETTFNAMPEDLQALFCKCPNYGSDEVLACFPESAVSGSAKNGRPAKYSAARMGATSFDATKGSGTLHNDKGSAARFFYCAKASPSERSKGLSEGTRNAHPTVKPIALMRYLVRLVTQPGGVVLDPFCGSGSTGIAAVTEEMRFVGIEQDTQYVELARKRIAHWAQARSAILSGKR